MLVYILGGILIAGPAYYSAAGAFVSWTVVMIGVQMISLTQILVFATPTSKESSSHGSNSLQMSSSITNIKTRSSQTADSEEESARKSTDTADD